MLKRDDALKTVVKFTTYKKGILVENGISKNCVIQKIGTGFFMKRDNVNNKLYVITANHVAKEFDNTTIIEIMGKNQKVISVNLAVLQNGFNIINHPTADISAIEIDVSTFNNLNSDVQIFCTSLIDNSKITNLSRDIELTSIGFPKNLGTNLRFAPLTFRSFPSSNIIENINLSNGYISDIFVLENPSCGGYSGGPVLDLGYKVDAFITQSSQTVIYGIMHGTISDDTGGKMAVVTPAIYILDII